MSVPTSVERRGEIAATRTAVRLADAARAQVPGARVAVADTEVVVTGRGVLTDAALRWPAALLR